MKRLFKVFGVVLLIVALLLAAALVRTWLTSPLAKPAAAGNDTPPKLDEPAALQRFAGAVKLHTVSTADGPPSTPDLDAFHNYLAAQFPQVLAKLTHEEVGHGALLFTWQGSDASLPPIVLMAHQDTVPVDPQTRARWHRDPWSGEIADGTVWGRGALDDKASLVSTLEAAEGLLQQGFQPKRTLYFAFGSDEENGGKHGADAIVALFKQRGIHAQAVVDEGGELTRGLLPGVSGDLALIGILEKGDLSIKLTVQAADGHSSQPPPQTAIGLMSKALARLEAEQMPARMTPIVADMLDTVAPLLPFTARLAVRNRWLIGPLLVSQLQHSPSGNAMVRTTTAETIFNGGIKDNMMPLVAQATVNFRVLPGDTVAGVLEHVRKVVNDARVEVQVDMAREVSALSPRDGVGYRAVVRTIGEVFPGTPTAPYLVVGATDSSHYAPVSTEQVRFVPYHLTPQFVKRFHGIDEGIPVSDYLDCVRFTTRFIQNVAG